MLREEIRGKGPGEAIATEAELEQRFGVSRITVRKAVDELASEGLVVREQGRGTFVGRPKLTHELNAITSWTEQVRALGYEPRTTHMEVETMAPPEHVARMLELEDRRAVRVKRLRLADDEPMSVMVNYFPEDLVPGFGEAGIPYESLYEYLEKGYRLVPAVAVDNVETREARDEEARLLAIRPASPVIYVTRISYLEDRSPLEVAIATFRGDRYQYRVTLSGRARSSRTWEPTWPVHHD